MFILTTHILLGEDKTVCGKKKKKTSINNGFARFTDCLMELLRKRDKKI